MERDRARRDERDTHKTHAHIVIHVWRESRSDNDPSNDQIHTDLHHRRIPFTANQFTCSEMERA